MARAADQLVVVVTSIPAPVTAAPAVARTSASTWPLYAVLCASLGIVVGLIWDISWHRSIGRDTFWSPPHVLIYCGMLATLLISLGGLGYLLVDALRSRRGGISVGADRLPVLGDETAG